MVGLPVPGVTLQKASLCHGIALLHGSFGLAEPWPSLGSFDNPPAGWFDKPHASQKKWLSCVKLLCFLTCLFRKTIMFDHLRRMNPFTLHNSWWLNTIFLATTIFGLL